VANPGKEPMDIGLLDDFEFDGDVCDFYSRLDLAAIPKPTEAKRR